MTSTMFYNPLDGPMPVVGFMSGSGSNLVRLLERQKELKELGHEAYRFTAIVTDRTTAEGSNALSIGNRFDIPVVQNPRSLFLKDRDAEKFTKETKTAYDIVTLNALQMLGIEYKFGAFAGYMTVASKKLCNKGLGVNVHPADLALLGPDGWPIFTGDDAVKLTIEAGERYIRASTHILRPRKDCGPLLMRSKRMELDYDTTPKDNQDALKKVGDLVIFPKTLEFIALGRFGMDEDGKVCFDGEPVPNGLNLEDIE